jgi:CMP-N-acetylneuraminic acid synthetase
VIDGRRVLAVVPARGGSKGVPLKNLRRVDGVPLVGLVGPIFSAVSEIDRAVVSTDHDDIARAAEAAGIAAPFRRPPELSGDRIGDQEVLAHALLATEELDGVTYDVVVMLQPTSPLRTADDVRRCLVCLVTGGWDAVWTLSATDVKYHPLKQLVLDDDGAMDYWDARGASIIARQQLEPTYHRNGVAYAITRSCLIAKGTIKGERTAGLIVSGQHVSIDDEADLRMAEAALRARHRVTEA